MMYNILQVNSVLMLTKLKSIAQRSLKHLKNGDVKQQGNLLSFIIVFYRKVSMLVDSLIRYCCEILTSWRWHRLSAELSGYTKKISKIYLVVLFLVGRIVCIANPLVIVLFLLTRITARRLLTVYKE